MFLASLSLSFFLFLSLSLSLSLHSHRDNTVLLTASSIYQLAGTELRENSMEIVEVSKEEVREKELQ